MIAQPFAQTMITQASFEDRFSDANGTSISGKALTIGPATWTLTSSHAAITLKTNSGELSTVLTSPVDATSYVSYMMFNSGYANVKMSCDLYNDDGASNARYGNLYLRYTNLSNYWYIGTVSFGANPDRHGILERTSGVSTERATFTGNFTYGLWPRLASASGNSIVATLNGTTVSYTSSSHSTVTTHGISASRYYRATLDSLTLAAGDNFKLFANRT